MFRANTAKKPSPSAPATSSIPLRLPREQEDLFHNVLCVFENEHLPHAVAGAFALQHHTGICRFTKDLDLFLAPPDASRALALLADRGFQCEVRDPVWLAKARRDGYFIDLITGMSNGAITVDASWIDRSHRATIIQTDTRVLAAEELIASKLFVVRRERFDGSDIAHIIYALEGRLVWNRILQLAGEHWELVLWNLLLFRYAYPAQTHYVPESLWDELLTRFSAEIRSPNPRARFRGSLLDDKMFAIDVDEWCLQNLAQEYREQCPKINAVNPPSRLKSSRAGRSVE